ncbi:extracellular calcium-sensing receptor-like [Hyla sarda]|uniref:extracellular calcium-sensing receptor-like n=1 Tax=Hyla sarda TaxID=327740 RepID=UPI0024C2AABC|nr:extracellular calcium-sensing receptor-like [Hyla sarda]
MIWYGRYIDDILIIWSSDVAAIPDFCTYINENSLNLRFTLNHEVSMVSFLDLHLMGDNEGCCVKTATFRKKTAVNSILHASSCHPSHVTRNLPTGEMVRARRNCSADPDFRREICEISSRLQARGYQSRDIERGINIASNKNRALLISPSYNKTQGTQKTPDSPVVFCTKYSLEYKRICNIIHKYMPIVLCDPAFQGVFPTGYKCISRRAPTIGQSISPSLFSTQQKSQPTWLRYMGSYRCGHNSPGFKEYRHILSFIFAINDVNDDPTILPNITLGYHLYDSCSNVNKVIKDVLQIMSGHSVTAPNYSCMEHGTLAGYIGDLQSATTLPMAQLVGMFGYTQVSYGARDSALSDRRLYPHFFRMVQNNEVQYAALVKLLMYFKWNMVCIFTTDDDIGERDLRLLSAELKKSGMCIELTHILTNDLKNTLLQSTFSVPLHECTGEERFTNLTHYFVDGIPHGVNTAVRMIAHALDDMHKALLRSGKYNEENGIHLYRKKQMLKMIKEGGMEESSHMPGSRMDVLLEKEDLDEELRHYMKLMCIYDPEAGRLCFNNKGEIPEHLEILNCITKIQYNGKKKLIQGFTLDVGAFDETLPPDQQLNISSLNIKWNNNKIPYSRCSEKCFPGFRKAVIEGNHICCYDCIACSEGEISNIYDAENCEKCFSTEWPNETRDKCIPKIIEFLSYETDVVAYVFLLFSILSSIVVLIIIIIFIFFRNTPVVRANNRNLSFILLVSLKLSFLCIFLYIGKPEDTTCMFRHISFGIIFTVVLSSILAKTIMVCIAFKATTPGSYWRQWIGVRLPNAIVLVFSSLQVLNGILWLSFSPPFQEEDMDSYPGKIIIQCNEGSRLAFYFMLGYMGFLAAVSFVLAFMVRTLPDMYNEAKYITFSMLVFCSVWIGAIPAYLSSKGKSMVSVEVFAILASGNGILFCIFLPKLWNLLTKPELNTRRLLVK